MTSTTRTQFPSFFCALFISVVLNTLATGAAPTSSFDARRSEIFPHTSSELSVFKTPQFIDLVSFCPQSQTTSRLTHSSDRDDVAHALHLGGAATSSQYSAFRPRILRTTEPVHSGVMPKHSILMPIPARTAWHRVPAPAQAQRTEPTRGLDLQELRRCMGGPPLPGPPCADGRVRGRRRYLPGRGAAGRLLCVICGQPIDADGHTGPAHRRTDAHPMDYEGVERHFPGQHWRRGGRLPSHCG